VWAETLRSFELYAILDDGFAQVLKPWIRIVEGYQEAGMMRADIRALSVARTMVALAQGFAAQYALFGDVPIKVVELGVKALMSMEDKDARNRAGRARGAGGGPTRSAAERRAWITLRLTSPKRRPISLRRRHQRICPVARQPDPARSGARM
jgi:hypothetical protein